MEERRISVLGIRQSSSYARMSWPAALDTMTALLHAADGLYGIVALHIYCTRSRRYVVCQLAQWSFLNQQGSATVALAAFW